MFGTHCPIYACTAAYPGRINTEVALYSILKKEVTYFFSPLKVTSSKSSVSSPAGVTSLSLAALVKLLAINTASVFLKMLWSEFLHVRLVYKLLLLH